MSLLKVTMIWVLLGKKRLKVSVAQLCLTFCDPVDYSPSGSSLHRILQALILEWVVIPFSRGSSWPRDWILVSCIASRFFIIWATREAPQDSSIAGTDLPTKNDHLNLLLTRINSLVTAFADLQHTLKRIQGGDQEWVTPSSGKHWQNRPSDS